MREIDKELYKDTQEWFAKRTASMGELEHGCTTVNDMLDTAFTIRETINYLKGAIKELEKVGSQLQFNVHIVNMSRHKKNHRTDYATCTNSFSSSYKVPSLKKNREVYLKLMEALGVSVQKAAAGIIQIHWPSLMKWLDAIESEGKPLPPGIKKEDQTTTLKLTMRKGRKEILE